ncbi:putative ribosomal RNA methyltransferase [Schistosoma mansoni]|uniref:putative ribosomal RNA methyltransferase n=1 Tax=Schistosoma mansoni TaxID=6183 RepID=UPI0001A63363|nr:putative ribosomal RNA methyltransferase [Schistosoma mansoni]|eukprot:XP_018654153.1 putative ribosomal RNA methyltransferase [Schistosoma mansoni]
MGKKIKTGKARKDKFYFLAKETGFRSRAAFKLIQLNRRFKFLNSSKVLIDLCAAPGGWLQVAAKEMPMTSHIIGVDLVPIHPIPKVKTFVADITTDKCKQILRSELNDLKADVVLHDGAPNVGAAWSIDEYTQAVLSLNSFAIATEFLRRGGWFVTKVFRSRDYEPLKWVLSQFFRTVRAIKPEASRLESAEIFLVGQNYIAPARIDPKFLDARHVFGEVDAPKDRAALISSFLKESRKKKAEGYDEGDTLYHELPLSKFLESSDPLEALAKANKVIFDVPEIACHPLTTSLIKEDFNDIQVLGKGDIKNLLKWRMKILSVLKAESKESKDSIEESNLPKRDTGEDEEDLEVETEVQRLWDEEEKLKKKKMKKVRKEKRKLAERYVLKMSHESDYIEQNDDELFSLAAIKDLVGLEESNKLLGDTSNTGVDDLAREQIDAALKAKRKRLADERCSAVEGKKRVHFERRSGNQSDEDLSDNEPFGEIYAHNERDDLYLSSEESSEGESGKENGEDRNSTLSSEDESSEIDEDPNITSLSNLASLKSHSNDRRVKSKRQMILPPGLVLSTSEQDKRNPLLVDLDDSEEIVKKKRKIDSWFGSDEIQEILAPLKEDENISMVMSSKKSKSNHSSNTVVKEKKREKKIVNDEVINLQDNCVSSSSEIPIPKVSSEKLEKSLHRIRRLNRPLTAEERAIATRLIHSAKSRRELLESGYNRYQFFEKSSDLPDWFIEDEKKHMRKPIIVKKEEIPVDVPTMGRSLSKAEQAKARKKARLAKRLKRIRQKAEGISDEIPETEKWQQIKQLYKKAGLLKRKRRPLHVVVNTKAGSRSGGTKPQKGAKIKIVDKRMKADLRGQQKAKDGKKHGKRKNKVGRPGRPKSRGIGKRR